MKTIGWLLALLLSGIAWGGSNQVTESGCVAKVNGDYALVQANRQNTYQLQGSKNIRLRNYLGQRVEVTGTKESTMPTSEDAINNRVGDASPITIVITSIKTISRECQTR
ncbi:MAG TPA: hypothetical protein VEI49_04235 [Terriglobales bacterium]|nr:hypothetical protein [Terriglobales bacterium]